MRRAVPGAGGGKEARNQQLYLAGVAPADDAGLGENGGEGLGCEDG